MCDFCVACHFFFNSTTLVIHVSMQCRRSQRRQARRDENNNGDEHEVSPPAGSDSNNSSSNTPSSTLSPFQMAWLKCWCQVNWPEYKWDEKDWKDVRIPLCYKEKMLLQEMHRRMASFGHRGILILRGIKIPRNRQNQAPLPLSDQALQSPPPPPPSPRPRPPSPPVVMILPRGGGLDRHPRQQFLSALVSICQPLQFPIPPSPPVVVSIPRGGGLNRHPRPQFLASVSSMSTCETPTPVVSMSKSNSSRQALSSPLASPSSASTALLLNGVRISLRCIERYMARLMLRPSESVYFRIRLNHHTEKSDDDHWTIRPSLRDYEHDRYYEARLHVWPVHMPWAHKLAADLVLTRYHQTFGRGTPVPGWEVATSVCQLHYMDTMLTHAMLERMCLRSPPCVKPITPRSRTKRTHHHHALGNSSKPSAVASAAKRRRVSSKTMTTTVTTMSTAPSASPLSLSSSSSSSDMDVQPEQPPPRPPPKKTQSLPPTLSSAPIANKPVFKYPFVFDYPIYIPSPPLAGHAWDGTCIPLAQVTVSSKYESFLSATRQHTSNLECDMSSADMYWPWSDNPSTIPMSLTTSIA